MPVHRDTDDMVEVFVVPQRLLDDNTNRRLTVELQAVLDHQQQLQHKAMHQGMVDRHIIFGMLHNCQLQLVALNQLPFVVSILFCNTKKK